MNRVAEWKFSIAIAFCDSDAWCEAALNVQIALGFCVGSPNARLELINHGLALTSS